MCTSPGRIHHCMRSIGAAQNALDLLLARVTDPSRKTFGKYLYEHGEPIHAPGHSSSHDRLALSQEPSSPISRSRVPKSRLLGCWCTAPRSRSTRRRQRAPSRRSVLLRCVGKPVVLGLRKLTRHSVCDSFHGLPSHRPRHPGVRRGRC